MSEKQTKTIAVALTSIFVVATAAYLVYRARKTSKIHLMTFETFEKLMTLSEPCLVTGVPKSFLSISESGTR